MVSQARIVAAAWPSRSGRKLDCAYLARSRTFRKSGSGPGSGSRRFIIARFKETQMFAAEHSRKNYLTDPADVIFAERLPAGRHRHDTTGAACRRGNIIFGDYRAVCVHSTDLVGEIFSEPDFAVD